MLNREFACLLFSPAVLYAGPARHTTTFTGETCTAIPPSRMAGTAWATTTALCLRL